MHQTTLLLNVVRVKAHGGRKRINRQDLGAVHDFLQQEAQKLVRSLIASAPDEAKADLQKIPYFAHVAAICQSGHHTKYERCHIPGVKGNVYLSFDVIPLNFSNPDAAIKLWSKYELSSQEFNCMLSVVSANAGKASVVLMPSYIDVYTESPDESDD